MKIFARQQWPKPDYELIARLECELLDVSDHMCGTSPEDLITEVRVEHEKAIRESGRMMPCLVDRLVTAEVEARTRWPELFSTGEGTG